MNRLTKLVIILTTGIMLTGCMIVVKEERISKKFSIIFENVLHQILIG